MSCYATLLCILLHLHTYVMPCTWPPCKSQAESSLLPAFRRTWILAWIFQRWLAEDWSTGRTSMKKKQLLLQRHISMMFLYILMLMLRMIHRWRCRCWCRCWSDEGVEHELHVHIDEDIDDTRVSLMALCNAPKNGTTLKTCPYCELLLSWLAPAPFCHDNNAFAENKHCEITIDHRYCRKIIFLASWYDRNDLPAGKLKKYDGKSQFVGENLR